MDIRKNCGKIFVKNWRNSGKNYQIWIDTVANKDDAIIRWEKVE